MPLQNRVTPFGEIIVVPDRGMLMGNRGCLHDHQRQIVRQSSSSKAWIVCLTKFKDRQRALMTPGRYTELYFLDEATGLAAGHRPCGECRRTCFRPFKAAWLTGNPQVGLGPQPRITLLDNILHAERLTAQGTKLIYQAKVGDLPDGTFIRPPGAADAFLLWGNELHHWTPGGYDEVHLAEAHQVVDVLTPRSTVNALQGGYKPEPHDTVPRPAGRSSSPRHEY